MSRRYRPILAAALLLASPSFAGAAPSPVAGFVELTQFDSSPPGPDKDWSPAFDAAFAALCPKTGACGGVIHLPSEIILVSRTIDVPPGVRIVGNGESSVVAMTRGLCSGTGSPRAVFRFDTARSGSALGPQSQGVEDLVVTAANPGNSYPCAPIVFESTARTYPYADGSGAYDACYARDAKGMPRYDSTRIDLVGIQVEGHGTSGITIDNVRACGLGTGMVATDAGGFANDFSAALGSVGLSVRGGTAFNLEDLHLHNDEIGLELAQSPSRKAPPTSLHVVNGLIQSDRTAGVNVHSCVNCSLDDIHFESPGPWDATDTRSVAPGGTFHIDGTGIARHIRIAHVSFSTPSSLEIENPFSPGAGREACPVDFFSLENADAYEDTIILDIRSDCALHAEPFGLIGGGLDLRLSRPGPDVNADLPDLRPLSIESHAPGVAAGTVFSEAVTGALSIGSPPIGAGMTLGSSAGKDSPIVTLVGAGSMLDVRFGGSRFTPAFALIRLTAPADFSDPTLELDTWSDGPHRAFVLDPHGNLGIGTATPSARLQVAGDAHAGLVIANAVRVSPDEGPCDPAHRGALRAGASRTAVCLRTQGAWKWMSIGAAQ